MNRIQRRNNAKKWKEVRTKNQFITNYILIVLKNFELLTNEFYFKKGER